MPDKEWLIGLADHSKWQCRQQLRRTIDAAINELVQDGWKPEVVAEALIELADNHMDAVIEDFAVCEPSVRLH